MQEFNRKVFGTLWNHRAYQDFTSPFSSRNAFNSWAWGWDGCNNRCLNLAITNLHPLFRQLSHSNRSLVFDWVDSSGQSTPAVCSLHNSSTVWYSPKPHSVHTQNEYGWNRAMSFLKSNLRADPCMTRILTQQKNCWQIPRKSTGDPALHVKVHMLLSLDNSKAFNL